ncbi:MAG: glutamate racemase [Gammaproteobacteria bacterium]|nr:glutamate racemase [Gammaproteobacteria bacterium]MCP5137914.1 glutamate racemase [Gammaproteobacteria bacterium]
MTSEAPIGVFDSGVGGLSVLRHIQALLPHEDLIYVADSAHLPYGGKSPEFVRARVLSVADTLVARGAKALVVACNTATALGIDELRARHELPVVGMEPGVKPAAECTESGVIGVLATSGTLASRRFQNLMHKHAGSAKVMAQPCPGWVELVESGAWSSPLAREKLRHALHPLLHAGADVLVLGCTHYPFLRTTLSEIAGAGVTILDTGEAVARELKRRIGQNGLLANRDRAGVVDFFTSGAIDAVRPVMERLWGAPIALQALTD